MDPMYIDTLVDRVSERVDTLINERNQLRQEVARLTAYAAQRDQDYANLQQEMKRAVEAAAEEARSIDRTNAEIVTKLEALNDRMIALVEQTRRGELAPVRPVLDANEDTGGEREQATVHPTPEQISLALQEGVPLTLGRSEPS